MAEDAAVLTRPAREATQARVLTSSQAARYLGISLATIRRWADAGKIQYWRTPGGQRRFSREECDSLVARGDA
jgi:excisionase family DNA binding protein